MAHTPPPPPGLEDLEALVLEILAQVWEEFNTADAEYCETTIGSLVASSVAEATTLSTKMESTEALPHEMYHAGSRASSDDTSTLGPSKPHVPHVCLETDIPTLTLPPSVESYSKYESWAPTNRSIFWGDDSDDMQFLPFADEPDFDKQAYRKFFKTLAWQGGGKMDADLELIVLEAAHRLHFDYGIELERIDGANVLPFTLLGGSGLIHKASQRDPFDWNGAARTDSFPLPQPPVPDALDLCRRLNSLHGGFCPSLNCIDFYCSSHDRDSWPSQAPPTAAKTTGDLWRECEKACSPKCFRSIERGDMSEETRWEDWDWEDFRTILEIAPDALPFIDDADIVARRDEPSKAARKRKVAQRGCHSNCWGNARMKLCEHAGPCKPGRSCSCYDTETYCDRNCGCLPDCCNRRVGCRCHVVNDEKGYICNEECPCVNNDTKCGNCQIQKGEEKYVEIIKSQWGFGTALLEPVREDEFIIGELVFPTSVDLNRQFLGDYMGRKYTYTLNDSICIDSVNAGNPSRSINHSDRPNCYARSKSCFSPHRCTSHPWGV
ncbi:hypothetical protein BDM02DRAFT_1563206 [Thelephora ganbajun]|uniref:Uncharacterized protein n=1 Tax=Thelephora ganbajun TaxID=370292 RepID=A0ACB6ZV88_THEGA|nr:hypothetical protein BDM02DRAFT_1563206 [Thelephora ganbajun]